MKKVLLFSCMLLGAMSSQAQTPAALPEAPLPTVAGPVLRPQNAGSSTMQNVNFSGAINHLYVHSWDVFSNLAYHGIAWRRTDAGGTTINQGFLQIKYADDIDVVLYEASGTQFVLAAYYYNDGTTKGHYYDIYKFTPAGLAPSSVMNLLTATPTFGRINVDGNTPYGIVITWAYPGVGIFVKAANLPGAVFGPTTLLPGTAGYKDPDVCIARFTGNLTLQIAYLSNANNQIREQRLAFANAVAGSTAGLTTEYGIATAMTFGVPRIDCPDAFSVQKWALVFAEYSYVGTTATEKIYAAVLNTTWSAAPTTVTVHSTVYATSFFQLNNPVVAYNVNSDRIHVGWITKDATTVIPGTTDAKYVAQLVADPGSSAPASVAASYMMISNTPGGPAPVLAFSGQNTMSNFNGLHTAYAQLNTYFPANYAMVYKDKPWGSATFKLAEENAGTVPVPAVFPNPFSNQLSLVLPLKGHYEINITAINGQAVARYSGDYEAMQQLNLQTEGFGPGVYFLSIRSAENQIDWSKQLIK